MLVHQLHQTTTDLQETACKLILVWVSLFSWVIFVCVCKGVGEWKIMLYSSFNLSFRSKVTQLWVLAPGGYSGAQLKICTAASCCQTRCTQANKNIYLSLLISSSFSVWSLYHMSSGSSFLYGSVSDQGLWMKKTVVWSNDSADKWSHTRRSLWCHLAGPNTDWELLLQSIS